MMALKKYIVFLAIAGVAIAAVYAYKEYHRKNEDLSSATPQEITSATAMITAFANDEAAATKRFAGKTVLVTGVIAEIINQQDTLINIFLGNETDINKVSCLMDMGQKKSFKNIIAGNQVSIKGICTGFLSDVEMNRCVILNEK